MNEATHPLPPRRDATPPRATMIGGGIGSLAAAAFMIRDGGVPGANVTILEASPLLGGSLDGAGDPERGYSLRGGRMLTTDNYECTWDLFRTIPSATGEGSVYDETLAFNRKHVAHSMARLVDRRRARVPVASMGFSMHDRIELMRLVNAEEDKLGAEEARDGWALERSWPVGSMAVWRLSTVDPTLGCEVGTGWRRELVP